MSTRFKCYYGYSQSPCWGELKAFIHYAPDDSIDDEWHACEGHQDMHITGIYLIEPDRDWDVEEQTSLDLSNMTLTQEQFDALVAVLTAVGGDEAMRAVDKLKKIWEIKRRETLL